MWWKPNVCRASCHFCCIWSLLFKTLPPNFPLSSKVSEMVQVLLRELRFTTVCTSKINSMCDYKMFEVQNFLSVDTLIPLPGCLLFASIVYKKLYVLSVITSLRGVIVVSIQANGSSRCGRRIVSRLEFIHQTHQARNQSCPFNVLIWVGCQV